MFLPCFRHGLFSLALMLLLLSCEVQGDCSFPVVPHTDLRSGTREDSYPAGTVLSFRCIIGYEPIQGVTPSLTCLDNSKWSVENPKFCQGRRCPPPTLENGHIAQHGDFRLGDEITFGCDEGYRLIGRSKIRCVLIGKTVDWNREVPYCQRIPCFPPPDIENGKHSGPEGGDYNYGSAVTYSCNKDFSLIGNASIACVIAEDGINGKWSGPAPECKMVQCPRPDITNGRVLSPFQPTYTYDHGLMVECNRGHTMVGSNYIKCGADNKWHPPLPKCEKGIFTTTTTVATTVATTTESTSSPETQPPEDDAETSSSTAIIIGSVVAVLVGLGIFAAIWKYRSVLNKGKANTNPSAPESYHAVSTHTEIGLEPKVS